MARARYVWDREAQELVPADEFYARQPARKTSDLPAPRIITDTMEPTFHPADGRFYDSKAKFRDTTRAHGCVEIGNENPISARAEPRASDVKNDLARSIAELGG